MQGLPPDTDRHVHPKTILTLHEHTHDQMHICVVICKHGLDPRSFLSLGSGDFIAGPGGEFSSRAPNFCALILGEETPLTANPERHRKAWPGEPGGRHHRVCSSGQAHTLLSCSVHVLLPDVAPSWLLPAEKEFLAARVFYGTLPARHPPPHPRLPLPPGRLQRGCLHICRVEGFEQDVWHSSHLKRTQCQSQTPRKKTVVIELLFFHDPGNYCVIFTIACRRLISQGACLRDTRHQPREPSALQTR